MVKYTNDNRSSGFNVNGTSELLIRPRSALSDDLFSALGIIGTPRLPPPPPFFEEEAALYSRLP